VYVCVFAFWHAHTHTGEELDGSTVYNYSLTIAYELCTIEAYSGVFVFPSFLSFLPSFSFFLFPILLLLTPILIAIDVSVWCDVWAGDACTAVQQHS
jgi:hypothetical protein